MEAVHTEIHECTEKGFGKIFREVIKQKKITNLLFGKKTNWGNKLEAMRQRGPKTMPASSSDRVAALPRACFPNWFFSRRADS